MVQPWQKQYYPIHTEHKEGKKHPKEISAIKGHLMDNHMFQNIGYNSHNGWKINQKRKQRQQIVSQEQGVRVIQ